MKKKITIEINAHSRDGGFCFSWDENWKISVKEDGDHSLIICNRAGLISLAKNLIALAQETVPDGSNFELDTMSGLEDGSKSIGFMKDDNL